jgi:hypothetical protein
MSEQIPAEHARIREIILIALFFVGLCAPLLNAVVQIDQTEAPLEMRRLTERPALPDDLVSLEAFPEAFDSYYDDHFGLRARLLRWHHLFKAKVLGMSPTDRAAIGSNGFLFLTWDGAGDYQLDRPWSGAFLDRYMEMLEQRRDWLAQRNCKFLFVITPNKHTIYPEDLPTKLVPRVQESPADQLLARLKEHPDIDVLDLRPVLTEAKSMGSVYRKLDTHWNDLGIFAGYRAIINHIREDDRSVMPPWTLDHYQRGETTYNLGDLAGMMGLPNAFTEVAPTLTPIRTRMARGPIPVPGANNAMRRLPVEAYETPGQPLRVVIMRDSYGEGLKPYLVEHFGRTVFAPYRPFSDHLMESEHPDLVILECVERYLASLPE